MGYELEEEFDKKIKYVDSIIKIIEDTDAMLEGKMRGLEFRNKELEAELKKIKE